MIAQWTPQRILTTLLPLKESAPSAQPTASAAAEPVPANTAPPPPQAPVQAAAQPEAPAQPAPQAIAPSAPDPSVGFRSRSRCRRWRTTSQMRGRRSSNSRPASSSSRVASSSSRQASNKYPATSPRRRNRTRFRSRISGRRLTAPTAAGRGTQAAAAFATAGDVRSDTDASRPALRATATRTAAARHGRPAGRSGLGVGAAAANAAALGDNANGNSYKHRQNSRGFRSG